MTPVPSSLHKHHGRVITYTLPGGWQVLVGRTDADNDYLSFRVAGPEDWWFTCVRMPGATSSSRGHQCRR
jgi:predicted ribosome quality control (RQC) complex YloA/Tae2 family protein